MFLKWSQWMLHLVVPNCMKLCSSCQIFILLTGLSAVLGNGNTEEIFFSIKTHKQIALTFFHLSFSLSIKTILHLGPNISKAFLTSLYSSLRCFSSFTDTKLSGQKLPNFFFSVSGSMHLHDKKYICAAIPAAELVSFTPFLEVRWQERDWARTRALCLTHYLSGSHENQDLEWWLRCFASACVVLKSMDSLLWKPQRLEDSIQGKCLECLSHQEFPGVNWHKDFLSELLLALCNNFLENHVISSALINLSTSQKIYLHQMNSYFIVYVLTLNF